MNLPTFWKNVITVLGGTAIAQVIPIAILPVLTRIVSADELGTYFVWFGATSILIVIASARLDMAVFSAKSEAQVNGIFQAVLVISCAVGIAGLLTVIAFQQFPSKHLLDGAASRYSVAWAVYAVIMANCQTLLAVYVYRAQFKRMASGKILLAGSVALAQLALSLAGAGLSGLVYGQLAMSFIVTMTLMYRAGLQPLSLLANVNSAGLKDTLKIYYRFPVIAMPSDFINAFATQIPLFLIAIRFGTASVALYALTLRVLSGPIGLLGNSILAVFKEQAGRDYRDKGNCLEAYYYAFRSLLLLAIIPFTLLFFYGEEAFVLIFGNEWSMAGRFAEILAPMFLMKFIASPLSYTLYIANKQLHDLGWQIALLLMTWAAFDLTGSLLSAVQVYSFGYSALYVIYLFISYRAARGVHS